MGKSRKEIFSFLRDRVWSKIKGWNANLLSKAGKEVLIKSVLQSVPTYVMSCFMLPNGLIKEIEAAIRHFWWGYGVGRAMAWMKWNNLCRSKEDGGLGLRDLYSFNLALLAKQVWRLIKFPDSLLSRILKARYFPVGDVWGANIGSRPSATWRSLVNARPFLRKGIRHRIGDGEDTSIWCDPWLVGEGQPYVLTPRPIESAFPNSVSDLILSNTGMWNWNLLQEVFWPIDRERILGVPIGGRPAKDKIVWALSTSGNFTVKSCYHQILAWMHTNVTSGADGAGGSGSTYRQWRFIWNMKVPPKIRIFVWRACSDIIPTKTALYKRRVVTNPICEWCGTAGETLMHVIGVCGGVAHIWKNEPFSLQTIVDDCTSFGAWWEIVSTTLSKERVYLAAMVAWKLWESRNRSVHGEQTIKMMDIIGWCCAFLRSYTEAQSCSLPKTPLKLQDCWKPPTEGMIKINVDASLPHGEPFFQVSSVARDASGNCIWWKTHKIMGRLTPVECEARAFLQALIMAQLMGWNSIQVEGDCLQVVNALNNIENSLCTYGAILDNCLSISLSFDACLFSFVKRQGNSLAHSLASLTIVDTLEGPLLPSHLAMGA